MTIFRRLSKNNSQSILEATARPSALLLGDFENKDNVIVSTEFSADTADPSSSGSDDAVRDMDESIGSLSLSQTFGEFSVKMDDKNESVRVLMDVPEDIPAEDLTIQLDNGILLVTGEIAETAEMMEQSFRLDEQSLDVDQMTATLNDGVLTIVAPKKDSEESTAQDVLPILSEKPPKVSPDSHKVIIVDVPGVQKEMMHVSYTNGNVRIAASRHFGRVRSFKRTIPVETQQFDPDRLQTYLYKGRLAVIVPPKEESVSRTIEIQTDAPRAA